LAGNNKIKNLDILPGIFGRIFRGLGEDWIFLLLEDRGQTNRSRPISTVSTHKMKLELFRLSQIRIQILKELKTRISLKEILSQEEKNPSFPQRGKERKSWRPFCLKP
jgi:hypothetical protein